MRRINFINIERPQLIEPENSPLVIQNPQNVSFNNIEYEYYGNLDFSDLALLLYDVDE